VLPCRVLKKKNNMIMKKINVNMKKNILLSLLILFTIQLMSQEKGSYVSLWGGMGPSGFRYKMSGVDFATPKRDMLLGGQAGIGYSYYFTKHVGISVGAGFSHYKTRTILESNFQSDQYFTLGSYTDNDLFGRVTDYNLRVRTQNWTEFQSGTFIEIPVMFNLQKKFGESELFGLYLSVGAKFQIPVAAKYSVVDGDNAKQERLMISAYYPEENLELGGFGGRVLPQYGLDNIHNPSEILNNAQGKLNFKFNMSAVAEAGFLFSLNRRIDISLGAFIDYGLLDINKKGDAKALFTGPETDYIAGAKENPGNGITCNSILNSTYDNDKRYVDKVKSFSYGGKVGLRIKLGKLSSKQEPQIIFIPCDKDKDTVYMQKFEKLPVDSILKEIKDAIREIPRYEMPQPEDKKTEQPETLFPDFIPQEDIDFLFEPIYFDFDKAVLTPKSIKDLDKKVELLNKYPEMKLIIFGNTCDVGNDIYNIKLGRKRAEVARNYLISKGISVHRLESGSMSKYQPEKPNTDESNRMHNRRDDFKPVYQKR
jgi:outer membrane protein OmpA-like peptidoglycan-associated protein